MKDLTFFQIPVPTIDVDGKVKKKNLYQYTEQNLSRRVQIMETKVRPSSATFNFCKPALRKTAGIVSLFVKSIVTTFENSFATRIRFYQTENTRRSKVKDAFIEISNIKSSHYFRSHHYTFFPLRCRN